MKNTLYKLTSYEEATPAVRAIYDDAMATLGLPFVLNWFQCQGSNEVLLAGNWAKLKSTLMQGIVPNVIKQLIIYNVSLQKGCDYCSTAHGAFANLMGRSLNDDPAFKVTEHLDTDKLPLSYRTAVRTVTKAALTPAAIAEADFEALAAAGFSESEITELMAQADLVNMLNTIADISGIKIDSELLEMA